MRYAKLRKVRRNSGRVSPISTLQCPKKFIIDNCLEPTIYWNDWVDWRDGMRFGKNESRQKIILFEKRRKARRKEEWD